MSVSLTIHQVEGGRNPLKLLGESLDEFTWTAQEAFFAENFIDMMGEGLAPEPGARVSAPTLLNAQQIWGSC